MRLQVNVSIPCDMSVPCGYVSGHKKVFTVVDVSEDVY